MFHTFSYFFEEDTINKDITKHRVTQLQLQKKIQQRSEDKDRKRKLQVYITIQLTVELHKCICLFICFRHQLNRNLEDLEPKNVDRKVFLPHPSALL